jgi:hypothetical protein
MFNEKLTINGHVQCRKLLVITRGYPSSKLQCYHFGCRNHPRLSCLINHGSGATLDLLRLISRVHKSHPILCQPSFFRYWNLPLPLWVINHEKPLRIPSHRIHGAGIFTYICPKNHPVLQVNLPAPWSIWAWQQVFIPSTRSAGGPRCWTHFCAENSRPNTRGSRCSSVGCVASGRSPHLEDFGTARPPRCAKPGPLEIQGNPGDMGN